MAFKKALALACAVIAGAMASSPQVIAADLLVTTAAPGTQFEMGTVERRGVRINNGVLLIRTDGCWFSNISAVNGNPYASTLSVSYTWYGRHGRPLVTIPAVVRESIPSGADATFDTESCDPDIARLYGTLSRGGLVRLVSVR